MKLADLASLDETTGDPQNQNDGNPETPNQMEKRPPNPHSSSYFHGKTTGQFWAEYEGCSRKPIEAWTLLED